MIDRSPTRRLVCETPQLQFVSLFAGIGGIDLGLERAGMRCVAQVEIHPFCQLVLRNHWPNVRKFTDIRRFSRRCLHARVDLVAGGFPCQDISNAGTKLGITGARSGLWKEMLRVVRSLRRPTFVFVENVAALRARGLEVVLGDLAESGFHAEWDCLPAASFGAPHLRDRLFIVAYTKRLRWDGAQVFDWSDPPQPRTWSSEKVRGVAEVEGRSYRRHPRLLRMGNGISAAMDRLRGCGNAVVPQVAEYVGRRITSFYATQIARV